ncbi:MAG: trypsin-like peptidase domain-containing protein, partial [Coriobacteriales bacterium]|nr:trypsin-like peptidase domain-containing protein [Coriobacteriales bacterium]
YNTAPNINTANTATSESSYNFASNQAANSGPNEAGQYPIPPYQNQEKPAKKKKVKSKGNSSFGKSFGAGMLGALVIVLIFCLVFFFTPLFKSPVATKSATTGTITVENSEDATLAEAVSAKCLDSVVTIYVYAQSSDWSKYFNGGQSTNNDTPSGLGSGVIVKSDNSGSYILTNYHVLDKATKAIVSVGDEKVEATPISGDASTDLAILKIDKVGLPALEWGDSTALKVGEWVMAIGSPYGYEQTVTTGVVSALYRSDVISDSTSTTVYTDMIQTDAAINPGNSGGALVNKEGKLIGINTYISSQSQSSAGLGFAIPSSEAQSIAEKLINGETITHAYLGVSASDSTNPQGAKIEKIFTSSPAEKAGLQQGDVITKLGDTKITNASELTVAVTKSTAGETYELTINRGGKEQTVKVTLEDKSKASNTTTDQNSQNGQGNGNNGYGYGTEDMQEFMEQFGKLFGYGNGNK